MVDRIIPAICKHIAAEDALAGGDIDICVEEAADYWVIISTLQVIEPRIGIIIVATVADGVGLCLHSTTFPTHSQEKVSQAVTWETSFIDGE